MGFYDCPRLPRNIYGPLAIVYVIRRFKGPKPKKVIGNLPDVDAGPRLALALTLRFGIIIVNHDQGDSAAKAADDPGKPEQAGDALGRAHGGRGEKPYQRHAAVLVLSITLLVLAVF